jgi:hypothetical protein
MKDKKNKKDKKDKKKKKKKTGEVTDKSTEVASQEGEKPKKSIEVASQGWDYIPITMEPWFQEGKAIVDEVLHCK